MAIKHTTTRFVPLWFACAITILATAIVTIIRIGSRGSHLSSPSTSSQISGRIVEARPSKTTRNSLQTRESPTVQDWPRLLNDDSITESHLAELASQGEVIRLTKVEWTKEKLHEINVSVDFNDKTLAEAVDYLRPVSIERDTMELDPNKKGVDLVITEEEVGRRMVAALKLDGQTLDKVLTELASLTSTNFHLTDYGVVFEDKDAKAPIMTPAVKPKGKQEEEIFHKLNNIVIPMVDLDHSTLEEARDFLWSRTRELDSSQTDPAKKGMMLELVGEGIRQREIHSLKLRNVRLLEAIHAVARLADVRYEVTEDAVRFASNPPAE